MAEAEVLRSAVQALLPANARPFFAAVPDGTTLPWSVVSISLPSPQGRALSTRIMNRRVLIRVRCVAANDLAVSRVARNVINALEGKRPVAAGWSCAPIQQLNADPQPYEDRDVKVTGTNAFPVIIPIDFDFYVTEENA